MKSNHTFQVYRGENCMDKLCETMNEIREMFEKMHTPRDKIISPEADEDFEKSKRCCICGGSLDIEKDKGKVWDHCHFTGFSKGAAHNTVV